MKKPTPPERIFATLYDDGSIASTSEGWGDAVELVREHGDFGPYEYVLVKKKRTTDTKSVTGGNK